MTSVDLNPSFQNALDTLENTDLHVFITGKAGTGKSTLLRLFREQTKKQHAVLAPTGVAAVNVEGETIHSFFGFSPSITIDDAQRIAKNKRSTEVYEKVQMIIIDEISMVRADIIDCMDVFLRTVRHNQDPFGGVQMVFIGDLFQLPPVLTYAEKDAFLQFYTSPYFFDSFAVDNLIRMELLEVIKLEKVYRQSDEVFVDILNCVRNKSISSDQIATLNSRYLSQMTEKAKDYVYLTAINQQAETLNSRNLKSLRGLEVVFEGDVSGHFADKNFPTDMELKLKLGSRVMFLNNDPIGRWINGTIGTVTKLDNDEFDPYVKVQIDDGKTVEVLPHTWTSYATIFNVETRKLERKETGSFTQLPLKLAWAITIHKSQGKTFDNVIIDIGRGTFAHGQLYVALSRCRSLEGIILTTPIKNQHIIMDDRVVDFMRKYN